MLAALTQLGYAVVAPDGLGLGQSSATNQAYLNHRVLSLVAIEMLRSVQLTLITRSSSRFRPLRPPELWLMGGAHGGYCAPA